MIVLRQQQRDIVVVAVAAAAAAAHSPLGLPFFEPIVTVFDQYFVTLTNTTITPLRSLRCLLFFDRKDESVVMTKAPGTIETVCATRRRVGPTTTVPPRRDGSPRLRPQSPPPQTNQNPRGECWTELNRDDMGFRRRRESGP